MALAGKPQGADLDELVEAALGEPLYQQVFVNRDGARELLKRMLDGHRQTFVQLSKRPIRYALCALQPPEDLERASGPASAGLRRLVKPEAERAPTPLSTGSPQLQDSPPPPVPSGHTGPLPPGPKNEDMGPACGWCAPFQ